MRKNPRCLLVLAVAALSITRIISQYATQMGCGQHKNCREEIGSPYEKYTRIARCWCVVSRLPAYQLCLIVLVLVYAADLAKLVKVYSDRATFYLEGSRCFEQVDERDVLYHPFKKLHFFDCEYAAIH